MLGKQFPAELIGTFTLCFMGCGTAMLVGSDAANGGGHVLAALAFGPSIVAATTGNTGPMGCVIVFIAAPLVGAAIAAAFYSYLEK